MGEIARVINYKYLESFFTYTMCLVSLCGECSEHETAKTVQLPHTTLMHLSTDSCWLKFNNTCSNFSLLQ